MDSEVQRDGRILDLIDDAWREDKLPYEDVAIPLNELPEPEQDNGGTTESVKEQEMKWTDLALQYLHENVPQQETSKSVLFYGMISTQEDIFQQIFTIPCPTALTSQNF